MKVIDVEHPDVQRIQQAGNLLLGALMTYQRELPVNLAVLGCLDAAIRIVRMMHPEFSAADAGDEVARIAQSIAKGERAAMATGEA